MKIAFFTENSRCGGTDTVIMSLINNWPNEEDQLTLICNYDHPGLKEIENKVQRPLKITRYHLIRGKNIHEKLNKPSSIINNVNKILSRFFKYSLFLYYIFATRSLLFNNNPDRLMVVNGGYPGSEICRAAVISWGLFRRKPRVVFNFHNLASPPHWLDKYFENIIDLLISRFSKVIVAVSKACSESLLCRPAFAEKNIQYIYNGTNAIKCSNEDNKKTISSLKLKGNKPVCLMLGSYEPRKGHDFLLRSFKIVTRKIPNASLVICGDGTKSEISKVEDLVSSYEMEPNVHLFEFRNDVADLMSSADLLLISSQELESFGLTAIEAMSCKVPVIATRVGGLPEVVKDNEGGYCFERNDVDGYAAEIIRLLENDGLRKEQGEKGYERFKKYFRADIMAKKYAGIIRSN